MLSPDQIAKIEAVVRGAEVEANLAFRTESDARVALRRIRDLCDALTAGGQDGEAGVAVPDEQEARPLCDAVHPSGAPCSLPSNHCAHRSPGVGRWIEQGVEGVVAARYKTAEYPSLGRELVVVVPDDWPLNTPVRVTRVEGSK